MVSRPKSRSCWLRRTAGSRSSRPWWPSFCAGWAGQHEQLEAAFERRLKKKPRAPAVCAAVRQDERRPGGPRGRHAAAGRPTRFRGSAEACVCRHCRLPLVRRLHRDREAPGVRSSRAPAAGDGASGFDLPLRELPRVTKAAFPEGVVSPAQYGERFKAAAVYMNVQQLIPEDRTAQTMSDVFGAPRVCSASVVAWVGEKAEELTPVYARIGERVAGEKVRHLDETGYRIGGKLQWLHTTSSLCFTFYRAGEKRGDIPRNLKGGVVVHDHFKPYNGLVEVIHAFCNAHILRELEGLIEFEKEPWAELMRAMLREANEAVRAAREAGKRALPTEQVEAFVERYWAAVRMGLAYHRGLPALETKSKTRGRRKQRPGHNLLDRLKKFKTETLRFLTDFDVPFTNNLAERDLRMMKVKMKSPAASGPSRARGFSRSSGPSCRPRGSRVSTSCKSSPRPPSGSCNLSPSDSRPEPRRSSATRRRVRRDGTPPHRKRRRRAFGTDPETPCRREDTEQQRTPTPKTSNLRNLAAASRAAPHRQATGRCRPTDTSASPTAPGLGVTQLSTLSFLRLVSRSRARSAARPRTTSCGFEASETHTISGRGFNLFKPLRRHFRATPFCHRALLAPGTATTRSASAATFRERADLCRSCKEQYQSQYVNNRAYRAPVRDGRRGIPRGRQRWRNKGASKLFLQAFPNPACFPPSFSKKALVVLCDFRGLQGSQTKSVLSKFFLRHRPPFDRVLGVIAPHSTGSRSVGASAICVAGERGRVHGRKSSSGLSEIRT